MIKVEIEAVFEFHLDGTQVQPGEEPRAKAEWKAAVEKDYDVKVTESELSPNGNYQFILSSENKQQLKAALKNYWLMDADEDGTESEWYIETYGVTE